MFKPLQLVEQLAAYTKEHREQYKKGHEFLNQFLGYIQNTWGTYPVSSAQYPYRVIAVDGSQIYPDRHQGLSWYVINLGFANFMYAEQSKAVLDSVAHLFSTDIFDDEAVSAVNEHRSELELTLSFQLGSAVYKSMPTLIFGDGLLITSTDEKIQALFEQFYQKNLLLIGYISLPRSRELLHRIQNNTQKSMLVDADVIVRYLPDYHRTAVFESHSLNAQYYPMHLRPFFFYLNTGMEIARIELPAWIVQQNSVDLIASLVLDQTIKGQGYPICLAEAHEQAVIRSADRELFYTMAHQLTLDQGVYPTFSYKSMRKRRISI